MTTKTLTHDQARRFYDRMGGRQDSQLFYERPALDRLVEHASFEDAKALVELGCGTGHLARKLLSQHLPAEATYRGFDLSPEMVRIARERLRSFGSRASADTSAGDPPLPLPDGACDRFFATYVFDLLPDAGIAAWLAEAHRLLVPGGLLGLVGITPGPTSVSRPVMALWALVQRMRPALVGGCRPVELATYLEREPGRWQTVHRSRVVAWGVASEVLVARSR